MSRFTFTGRILRRPKGVTSVLVACALAFLSTAAPASAVPATTATATNATAAAAASDVAAFVGGDGAVYALGPSDAATAITMTDTAPAGAPVAVVRAQDGSPTALFADRSGAVRGVCLTMPGSLFTVMPSGTVSPGAPLAAALAGSQYFVVAFDIHSAPLVWQSGVSPCGISKAFSPLPKFHLEPQPWYLTNTPITAVSYADGSLGMFSTDANGAVHAIWASPTGAASSTVLTSSGSAGPRTGISTAPNSNAATTPGALALFYFNAAGILQMARPAEYGVLTGPPQSAPSAPTASGSARLSAAATANDVAVGYIGTDGSFVVAHAAPSGGWLTAGAATPPGFARPGSSVAMSAAAHDGYCGNGSGQPGHLHLPAGAGSGTWFPSGPPNMVGDATGFGAV